MAKRTKHPVDRVLKIYVTLMNKAQCLKCGILFEQGFAIDPYSDHQRLFCTKQCARDWFDGLNEQEQQFILQNLGT